MPRTALETCETAYHICPLVVADRWKFSHFNDLLIIDDLYALL